MQKRYTDLNSHLREIFGCRVQKITVDAGFSCPNRDGTISKGGCIYCNVRGSGTGKHRMGMSITDQLEAGKKALSRRYKTNKFIAYFQSYTNTYAPLERLQEVYDEALAVSGIVGLSIGTRPDCVSPPVLDLLAHYAQNRLVWIEYGLQSIHDETLALINRGHDFACFEKAVQATKDRGIKICTHVILGLPGETKSRMLETAQKLAQMGIDGIKLHLLYVIRGTTLADLYQSGKYKCLTQQEYVDWVCAFIERLPKTVVIQRLTGDPHPQELLAPRWSLAKSETLTRIREHLEKTNTYQGRLV